MEFKEKIKQLRKEKNISQYKLAEALNLSRSVIAKWETGLVVPNDDYLNSLSKYFNVDILYFKEDEKYNDICLSKNKKIYKQKKMIILLSITSLFLLLLLLIFIINFSPRSISSYIKEDINSLSKFEVVENDEIISFDIKEDINIVKDILNTKVVPTIFFHRKHRTSYAIILCFDNTTYTIDGNSIKKGDKIYHFYEKNYSLYSIIHEYIGV